MKRILCFILALLLLCPAAFAAEDLTFTFSKVEGKVGDTVTIVASAKGAPVACSYKLVMVYDTKVLKPIEVKKIKSKGFFMSNIDATYEGKAAVNALCADAKKAFEGDCDLFSVSFEILAAPDGNKSVIEIPYYECYDYDLKMLNAAFDECSVGIIKDQAAPLPDSGSEGEGESGNGNESLGGNEATDPEGNEGEGGSNESEGGGNEGESNAGNTEGGSEGNSSESDKKPADSKDEQKENDKTPTGDWDFFEQTDEVTHSENGDVTVYKGEFIRDENDKITDIQLFDEEGKPAGSLKVEEKEDGSVEVIEQDLNPATEPQDKPFNHLYWIIPAALVLAGGVAVLMIIMNKKATEE